MTWELKEYREFSNQWQQEQLFYLMRVIAFALFTSPNILPGDGQIECWFSILVRRLLKRSTFNSTIELEEKILNFIDYFNRTMAKPNGLEIPGVSRGSLS